MRTIENHERRMTPAAMRAKADGNLKNFMAAITPGGIEAQEKAGQMEQAARQTLPIDLGQRFDGSEADARKPWLVLGFKFGKKIDDLFVEATFPPGWKKVPTNHDMWTDIVDEKGRKRGGIFYKAAFYDQKAHARLNARFSVRNDYERPLATISVSDACGIVDFKVSSLEHPDWRGDRAEADRRDAKQKEAHELCVAFLNKNFPGWESPTAHWP